MKGDLMKDIRPEHVPAAISRGKFEQMELFEFAEKVRVVAFCKLLLKLRYETLAPYPEVIARFTEFELGNLQLLDRFRELCLHVAEKHYPDVFHLWTAETNGLNYFLTTDQKFINVMGKKTLSTRPIAPRDLLAHLGVKRLDPLPFSDGKWHPFYEAL
jgi:hypothetical protein